MKPRTRNFVLIAIGAVLVIAVVAANLIRTAGGRTAVQAVDVKRAPIASTVRAPGRVQPETMVKLSANVPGEVTRLAVKEGDRVRKGQFLLQLDDTQYRAQVREARAALEAARSTLRSADAAFERSDASLKRKEALHAQNLVSPEELEAARAERNADRARVDTNREEVQRAEAALQSAEDNLRKTRFDSPIDGTVTQLNIEVGEIVVTGTMNNPGTVILTVANLSGMKVEADVDETDVTSVRLAQTSTVKVDAFPDSIYAGSVVEIANSPVIENVGTQEQETNFEVDVRILNPPAALRPGMTADVEIKTASKDSVLVVPIQAVVMRTPQDLEPAKTGRKRKTGKPAGAAAPDSAAAGPGGAAKELKGVFVIVDGKARFRTVTTGIASDTDFEVQGDLKPGEKVITGPFRILRTLKPETPVKIEEPRRSGKER